MQALSGDLPDVFLHFGVNLQGIRGPSSSVPANKRVVCAWQTFIELLLNLGEVQVRARGQTLGPRLVECLQLVNEPRLCAVFDLEELRGLASLLFAA